MRYYMAPLEGVTTWIYRKAQADVYGPLDKYFIPFIECHEKRDFKTREKEEILPEHNEGLCAVPQILTNRADGFWKLSSALGSMGYKEINLNLGCPSKTVVSRGKGSGFLAKPEELDHFLEEIFSGTDLSISVKTRIGKDSPEEFSHLLEIFNKYPIKELIIHPRVQADYYKNEPRRQVYREAKEKSKSPLCYNGDLFTAEDLGTFFEEFPDETCVMLGRGLIRNPGLLSENGDFSHFREFHQRVYEAYLARGMGDVNVLYKMKELWCYQILQFEDAKTFEKRIKKARTRQDYESAVSELFASGGWKEGRCSSPRSHAE